MREWLKDREIFRIAVGVCLGLLAYRVSTGMFRAVFYDDYHGQWQYGWIITVVLLASGVAYVWHSRKLASSSHHG